MKVEQGQKALFFKCLKKLCLDLKILILIVLLGAANTLSGSEPQQLSVSGTVTDASTGIPMPGVNVVIKGTVLGALTDLGGKYTLTVSDQNAVLVFSFIGYLTVEEPVSGRTTVNAALSPATTELEEVIVTGYGTQKKSDLTGSVVRVAMDERHHLPT